MKFLSLAFVLGLLALASGKLNLEIFSKVLESSATFSHLRQLHP